MAKRSPVLEARRSELIVLFLLMDLDRSGYEIRTLIRTWNIERYLPVSPTTIYRALERLAREGFVCGESRKSGRYPVSTVYAITEKGRQRYKEHILAESLFARTSYSLDSFLGLANFLTHDERQQVVHEWQDAARARVAGLDARIEDKVPGPGHTYGKAYPEWLLLDHERDMLKAEIAWMDKYVNKLALPSPAPAR
jgi:DNA-binding PadR family transcriptional regulator